MAPDPLLNTVTFLMYGLLLVTLTIAAVLYRNAYPVLAPLLKRISAIVKSSIVVSPFSKKQSFVLVNAVGVIFVARTPAPRTVTPAGTVKGNTS